MDAETVEKLVSIIAAQQDIQVKSQQRGEPDITENERREILKSTLEKSPAVFLERWGRGLPLDALDDFARTDDPNIPFIVGDLRERLDPAKCRQRAKNRRYNEMLRRQTAGEYFSEDAMRRRAPELYQEYVGQYLTQSEKNDAIQRDRDRAAAEGGPVQGRVLSDFFMRALEREEDLDAAQYRQPMRMEADASDIEEFDTESDDDEDMEGPLGDTDRPGPGPGPARAPRPGVDVAEKASTDGDEFGSREGVNPRPMPPSVHYDRFGVAVLPPGQEAAPTQDQKDALREEFARIMRERFLAGKDEAVDYGAIDSGEDSTEPPEYWRDMEDRYFDDDDS